ncbi:MAG: hypothetical protein FD126_2320, partial [Elusimicrobia bacterium]
AVTDAGARALHWFAGGRYLGKAPAGDSLDWDAEPGRWLLRAVDDAGRAASLEVAVEAAP